MLDDTYQDYGHKVRREGTELGEFLSQGSLRRNLVLYKISLDSPNISHHLSGFQVATVSVTYVMHQCVIFPVGLLSNQV